jgi:hypothetical protein
MLLFYSIYIKILLISAISSLFKLTISGLCDWSLFNLERIFIVHIILDFKDNFILYEQYLIILENLI